MGLYVTTEEPGENKKPYLGVKSVNVTLNILKDKHQLFDVHFQEPARKLQLAVEAAAFTRPHVVAADFKPVTALTVLKQVAHGALQTSGNVCAVRALAATSSLAVVPPMIRVLANNPFACCVVVKEDEKSVNNEGWWDGWSAQKSKNAYFPLLIRMPQGAKLPIFLDYLYRRMNKLIKT